MGVAELARLLGDAVEDPEEESFLLFSRPIPSSNLGFVDSKATELELSINGQDVTIRQSPGLLNSSLQGGTTGAVVWKVSPAFAEWISERPTVLFETGVLSSTSVVIELGAGISGLVALALAPHVRTYVASDQSYVLKTLRSNIASNQKPNSRKKSNLASVINVLELDWEDSNVSDISGLVPESQRTSTSPQGFDAIVACDCIYNEALIPSFVDTCANLCALRMYPSTSAGHSIETQISPTVCIIAQQMRSNLVFEEWLKAFHQKFQVWRVPDDLLSVDLREGSGFIVHIGILRQAVQDSH